MNWNLTYASINVDPQRGTHRLTRQFLTKTCWLLDRIPSYPHRCLRNNQTYRLNLQCVKIQFSNFRTKILLDHLIKLRLPGSRWDPGINMAGLVANTRGKFEKPIDLSQKKLSDAWFWRHKIRSFNRFFF